MPKNSSDEQKTKSFRNCVVIHKNIPFVGHARQVERVVVSQQKKKRSPEYQQTANNLRGTYMGESDTNERSKWAPPGQGRTWGKSV